MNERELGQKHDKIRSLQSDIKYLKNTIRRQSSYVGNRNQQDYGSEFEVWLKDLEDELLDKESELSRLKRT